MIAILIGATGLIGKALLRQLLEDGDVSQVKVFHRRSTGVSHPKLEEHIIDFDKPNDWADWVRGDVLFSTLGTTLKAAGSKEAQYKVDFTYNFQTAEAAAKNGVKTYVLLSSAGADPKSMVFYSRMKGELDEAVKQLDFEKVRIIKPSVLDGDRDGFRLGERIGIVLAGAFSFVPGVRKYRPIKDEVVARAMIHSAQKEGLPPVAEFELEEVHDLSK